MHSNRRCFLGSALTVGAGLALASSVPGIEPFRRTGQPHLRLSLAAYSYRKYLDLKLKPRPRTLENFADLAAEMGLDAIEPTSYYFEDTSPEYMAKLKGRCTRLGLDISGTAVRNDFCVADPDRRKRDIEHVKTWVELTSRLGGKCIRIFAGNTPRGESEEIARSRCVEAIQEACDHAGKYGIYLALENHGGITATVEQILAIVKAVKHEWFGVNLDTGNFHTADPYADLARLAPYAVNVQVKTEISRGKKKEDADMRVFIHMLRDVGYRGYVALEYEAAEEPKTAIPRHIESLKKLVAG
jgi:sugar phosphate isomerase/epimerase